MVLSKKACVLAGTASLLGLGVLTLLFAYGGCRRPARTSAGAVPLGPAAEQALKQFKISVTTIHPRSDPAFVLSVQQPAFVEGFFHADLLARAAGPVKAITKDIGNTVVEGELLMELDVPDLVQMIAQKGAVVEQRKAERVLAQDQVRVMESAVETARNAVDVQKAQVAQADSTRTYRESEYRRFVVLADRKAVTPDVVDETLKNYQASVASLESARAGVRQAIANWEESKAKLQAAHADVNYKRALVEVADRDREYAQVLAGFAKIQAPFDGRVTRRLVDPGSFVQNASNSGGTPFLSLVRTDLVTVVMKLPDNYAPFVNQDTLATIHMRELTGIEIEGRVTRLDPAIDHRDRTRRVEVDFYNKSRPEYNRFLLEGLATYLSALCARQSVLEILPPSAASRARWSRNIKGESDLVPLFPKIKGRHVSGPSVPMMPGMYGTMRLWIKHFQGAYLIPSGAVFSRGGKLYVIEVTDSCARLVPVKVQIDDGILAKILVVRKEADPKTGQQEESMELTGREVIVLGNQGEISDGQAVKATLLDEWPLRR